MVEHGVKSGFSMVFVSQWNMAIDQQVVSIIYAEGHEGGRSALATAQGEMCPVNQLGKAGGTAGRSTISSKSKTHKYSMNSQLSWWKTISSNSPYRDDRVHRRESLFEGLTLAARCSSRSSIFGEKERTVKAPDHGEKARTVQGPVEEHHA